MKFGIKDIYGTTYMKDRCFDASACKIGENLLEPGIALKKRLENLGHSYHTLDLCEIEDLDAIIFQDIPQSIKTIDSVREFVGYFVKKKWKQDSFYKVIKVTKKEKRILVIMEPPTVWPKSYQKKYHKYFGRIMTWDDKLVDKYGYMKFYVPQYQPENHYDIPFEEKKYLTMICGNKTSNIKNELYSERRKIIDYYEGVDVPFDLYGMGWEKEKLKNYKGKVDKKLDTLSNYKYCVCFENMTGLDGYVTEKIFDCFFANCVPIYWGANNIADLFPEGTYIDARQFKSTKELDEYLNGISRTEYNKYIDRINEYLNGEKFNSTFSVGNYVHTFSNLLLEIGANF